MFCTKCGNELFDEAIICPKCGIPTRNFNSDIAKTAPNQGAQGSGVSFENETIIKCQCYNGDIDFSKISLSKLTSYSSVLLNVIFKFQRDRLIVQTYNFKDNSFAWESNVSYDSIRKNHLYETKYMFLKMTALNFSCDSCELSMVSNGTNSISVGGDFDSPASKIKQIYNEISTRCKKEYTD